MIPYINKEEGLTSMLSNWAVTGQSQCQIYQTIYHDYSNMLLKEENETKRVGIGSQIWPHFGSFLGEKLLEQSSGKEKGDVSSNGH